MWNPKIIDTDRVLYVSIADAIERDILAGVLKANEKMPTQRYLAKIIGVNLTTITRAYNEAKKRGLIYGTAGKGTFVMQSDKRHRTLPRVSNANDSLIDLGLVGSVSEHGSDLSKILRSVAKENNLDELFGYVPNQGLKRHREVAAGWLRRYGFNTDADSIVICAGATHAINCCLLGLFNPGDKIAVDALTFTGFKNAAALAQIKLEPVEMDSEGMIPVKLLNLCRKQQIKGIYLMPSMQNPTAAVMSKKRKHEIADIIEEYGLILIEDDIYNFTNQKDRTSISEMIPQNSVFICGLSKALLPGLRIAFTVLPDKFLDAFIQTVTNTAWMAAPICSEIASRLIENGIANDIVENKLQIIHRRLKIAEKMLEGFAYRAAENSMFVWLELPHGWTCANFEHEAFLNGVRVISAFKFYVGNGLPPNAVRISLGWVRNDEELIRGLSILVRILNKSSLLTFPVM